MGTFPGGLIGGGRAPGSKRGGPDGTPTCCPAGLGDAGAVALPLAICPFNPWPFGAILAPEVFFASCFLPASSSSPISDSDEELELEAEEDRSRLTDLSDTSFGSSLTFLITGWRSRGGLVFRLTGTRSTGFGFGSTLAGLGGGARLLNVLSLC